MIGVVAIGLLCACAVLYFAVSQPWLGLKLAVDGHGSTVAARVQGPSRAVPLGAHLTAIGDGTSRIDLTAGDLLIEPDGNLPRFADYETFLARQDALAAVMRAPRVELFGAQEGIWAVTPLPQRPIGDLPTEFWVALFVGLVAWLIAGSIWVFRSELRSARYLLLSGASTLVFSPFAAVYGTRELAMASAPFRFFSDMNFFGGSLFIAALVALMLYYPRAIAPAWIGRAVVALFVGWFVAQQVGLFDSMVFARRALVFVGLIATFALAAVQWRGTRFDPVARAALQWFLLSWLVGCSAFAALIFVPQMFGIDTSKMQAFGFLLFVPVYAGLAFGIIRYRLFDLGEWWARTMTWMLSLVMLVVLDMLFLLVLHLSPGLSIGLALLVCGLVWLPLRGLLWGRLVVRRPLDTRGRFQRLADAAFQDGAEARGEAWTRLLQSIYDPLESTLQADCSETAEARLAQDGLVLIVPAAGDVPPLRLANAQRGRHLFNRADVDLANDLAAMFDHLVRNRGAFDAGAATERKRIAQDIHDHVGATLLDALHSPRSDRKDRLIRDTLSDLRGIINGTGQQDLPIGEALVPIRRETAERLETKGIRLDWQAPSAEAVLDAARLHTVRSIVREAVSNAIKHAECSLLRVSITLEAGELSLVIEDDGKGFDPHGPATGAGLVNIRDRATVAGGDFSWLAPAGGFVSRLHVQLPVPAGT
ncbi:ATP-binding protein [Novosphingobium sp. PS1R-30]|uniref:histidine kinase n=1 Tax=Novosphingobium anseongense TaxID=3133436 RepID=A0ABU8RZG7_9SPHN